jgi:hypothetical protein
VKYHRDVLGGENIANFGIQIMKYGIRPGYLPFWSGRKPPDPPKSVA